MDQFERMAGEVIHLARFGADGRARDVKALARRMAYHYRSTLPALADELAAISSGSGVLRTARRPVPVDAESRMPLARIVDASLAERPIMVSAVASQIDQIVEEYSDAARLLRAGLAPTRTALLVGPPGVGKTMAGHWIAAQLGRPLVVLDLATAISSFLGRSGQNVRQLFEFGREFECVLMLDELDAIAKRRADETDLGELKRLVNVLLQELDQWPEGSLLIAATNHPDLLDPAIWRRFEVTVHMGMPGAGELAEFLRRHAITEPELVAVVTALSDGMNYSEVHDRVQRARKRAVLKDGDEKEAVLSEFVRDVPTLPRSERHQIAIRLGTLGLSQRRVAELTGTSRNTLRMRTQEGHACLDQNATSS